MILYLLGGATVALLNIFLQLSCDAEAFNINWRREAITVLVGAVFGLLSAATMTGGTTAWPLWTHYAVGTFAGALAFVFLRGFSRSYSR